MKILYIETSIVSHATAWPSSNIQTAALQHEAREWWTVERQKFHLVTSQLTITEASAGDEDAAKERLAMLENLPLAAVSVDAERLAGELLSNHVMPEKAAADALHVAIAATVGADYLLTQNCKHIANAHELPRVYNILESNGFDGLLICTPNEFLGGDNSNDE